MHDTAGKPPEAERSFARFREARWLALWAAMFGFMLDALDVMLYVFAINSLRAEFGLSRAQAGAVGSVTMMASAAGGALAGWLADRIGRRSTLMLTILTYSFASAGTALSGGLAGLLFWRALVGLGLGGEWSAGATLVSESWPAKDRGKAIGFMQSGWAVGYMLAAAVAAFVLPRFGWRVLFLVGLLPALLVIPIRRKVVEPPIWTERRFRGSIGDLFRRPLRRITLIASALASATMFAYWGLFTWLPGFLGAPASEGGAGLTIVTTSAWVILMQAGALAGYILFGVAGDRFGRRITFAAYVTAAAALTAVYGSLPRWGSSGMLPVLAPLLGFFGTGYFSLFGAMLAELYPTPVRATGQGLTYNLGRGLSAAAPFIVGAVADRSGFAPALALSSGFFVLAAGLVFLLPETRRTELA
ncbi:MAG: MFS transporter [Acidobacteria bacterium]|nr:MFS transporter [Acidobacteriota bacterium]